MVTLLQAADLILSLISWVIIGWAVLSWLLAFNVINARNQVVAAIWRALSGIAEPLCAPIRRILPNLGGIDVAPIVVLIVIFILRGWIHEFGISLLR